MMSHKQLYELLKEDQEPFQLKHYIATRKSELKSSQKAPPISKCNKNALSNRNCFFSLQYSPDPTKSPLGFAKSPNSIPVRLKIPTRTAALLFEAAIRIKTQSCKKPRSQIKNLGFNLFGSILKKISRTRKGEIGNVGGESVVSVSERGFSAISSSSGVWSVESNSLDMESSCSSGFYENGKNENFNFNEKQVCLSPMSPFRFSLQKCPSSGRQTPVLSSPATSPGRIQVNENRKFEEEEEKEQFSPVSVLDPLFEEDDDACHDVDDVEAYDIECSYKFVEKAKEQLMRKLRRFEKLAELDPIELEKRMLEEEVDNEELEDENEHEEVYDSIISQNEKKIDEFVNKILCELGNSRDMKKLVFDIVQEENKKGCNNKVTEIVQRRLDSWKEVQLNTIDMMVSFDFRGETEEWKGNGKDCIAIVASEIETSFFNTLVEEFAEELLFSR